MSFTGSTQLAGGQQLASRFRILQLHTSGRYTRIYRACDEQSGALCAIKAFKDAPVRIQPMIIQRMANEARILKECDHPNILPCFWDATTHKPAWLAVEWIAQGSLRRRLEHEGPLPLQVILPIAHQILGALDYLHQRQIIHRDIKPDNILLRDGREAVLCDFGIAQLPVGAEPRLTVTNAIMGSLNFMAPEQRIDARDAGPAADLYAVGCTVYQGLTGWSPYNLFMAGRTSPRWAILREDLADVLYRSTRPQPRARFASSAAFLAALERCTADARPAVVGETRALSDSQSPTLPLDAGRLDD